MLDTAPMVDAIRSTLQVPRATAAQNLTTLATRVRGEYFEMPGLRLTVAQAARLFGVAPDVAHAVLEELRRTAVLTCSERGTYSLNR